MKSRRFDIDLKPLQLQRSLVVESSVPDSQNYNADAGEYTPDYTLTPLILQPYISIIDKDEMLQPGKVNISLTNIKWYEIVGGVETLIATDNTSYAITTSGYQAGRIKVKKNVAPAVPLTLRFYAEYIDKRNNQVHIIQDTHLIKCTNASSLVRVELNAATQTLYNPFTDPDTQQVEATVFVGGDICDDDKYALAWEVQDSQGWHEIGDSILDYYAVQQNGGVIFNRRLMGSQGSLRCRVKYSATGDTDEVELTDASPSAMCTFVRRLPSYSEDFAGVDKLPYGTKFFMPRAVVKGTNGVIDNFEKELLPLWFIGTNKASGALDMKLVAHGVSPAISTAPLSNIYGAKLELEARDRGPACAWCDSDNKIIVDSDNKILLLK